MSGHCQAKDADQPCDTAWFLSPQSAPAAHGATQENEGAAGCSAARMPGMSSGQNVASAMRQQTATAPITARDCLSLCKAGA
jgi:hypothetical protein